MRINIISVILIASVLLSSCSFQRTNGTEGTQIPNQASEYKVPNPIPQPQIGKGSVVGQIITNNPQDLIGLIIYLGELIQLPENMYGAYLDAKTAPSSLISIEDGKFYLGDVEPGIYSLIIYEVMAGGKVYQDSNGSAIPVSVVDGEITDIGTIEFNLSGEK